MPLISVTGTNVLNSTQTLKALVRFCEPTFGINQADQWDISTYGRFVLDPADPTTMYYFSYRADIAHFYGYAQTFGNAIYKKI